MTRKEILDRLEGTTGYITIGGVVYQENAATKAERAEMRQKELEAENLQMKLALAELAEVMVDG